MGLGLENRRLAAQPALEIQVGIEAQALILDFALATQRPGEGARQLRYPVGRVQRAELQRGVPGNAIGKAQLQMTVSLALPGDKLELRQDILLVRSPANGLARLKALPGHRAPP